jgi:hypothetical protein
MGHCTSVTMRVGELSTPPCKVTIHVVGRMGGQAERKPASGWVRLLSCWAEALATCNMHGQRCRIVEHHVYLLLNGCGGVHSPGQVHKADVAALQERSPCHLLLLLLAFGAGCARALTYRSS